MLKIKKEINLKKLEKYGFELNEEEKAYFNYDFGDLCGYDPVVIYTDDNEDKECIRIIQIGYETAPNFIDNTLFDMITNNLVEKVKE